MVVTGDGELGFDSGEGAWETATTSKEGSRCANYPILTRGVKKLVVGPRGGSAGPPHGEHRCSGPHVRYTDVFNESMALADRPGVRIAATWAVRCPRRREKSTEPYHLEEGEVVTRFPKVNLRKDHCRNLPSRMTRERVIKHQREGVWSLHCTSSPPCPGDTGTRVPVAKQTTPDVNYAKESE
ncbi:hypothetical protein V6N13_022989 [Hibiscus sabdariffa]